MKKIGLFGGSFDPVHKGHIELAKKVIKNCSLDELWFIPTFNQPLKDGHVESYKNRFKLLEIATKDYKKIKVCDIESKLPSPSYTFNTVTALKALHPEIDFKWIIGDDQMSSLDKWYKIDDLLALVDFIVVNRNNVEVDKKFTKIDFYHPASSSAVRTGNFNFLDKAVIKQIYKDELYFPFILKQRLSEKRAKHVLRCVEVAKEIGAYYNVDQTDLYKAVILHDITKEMDKEKEINIMKKYFKQHLDKHHKIYHQYTATVIAKQDFCINDKKILAAIASHTTGDNKSLLAMLTYVADKLERGRSYEVEHYIELCKENIYRGFEVVKADALKARKIKESINNE